ncbi:PREDICTED: maltase-glucoamylase, intestinal-like [Priapulus caudatus]|uniref:Maltase-glucoamylase, intestinal-like n=1 Tax=Priapulus caudatus TaxID=37621 RepID=A0ABM1F5T3_PRICU|nr:PREDICTED: maltase-glucoamylase, intestinal-like [Priapulus caudatus]
MEYNMFGIPYVGADICGFFGNADAQMCRRWQQLGAFYPFSRNHNAENNVPQDPATWGEEVARDAAHWLRVRYDLLPYLYTLFHRAHAHGETVFRPMFFEWPTDQETWGVDEQFLWGDSILIAPVLNPPPFLIRVEEAGKIAFRVFPSSGSIYESHAKGTFFWDDGVSIDTYENGHYFEAFTFYKKSKFTLTVSHSDPDAAAATLPVIDTLIVHAVMGGQPKYVLVNGVARDDVTITWTEFTETVRVDGLAAPIHEHLTVEFR